MHAGKPVPAGAVTRRTMLLGAAFAASGCGGGGGGGETAPAPTPAPPPSPPSTSPIAGTDGAVHASALSADGKTLYIGGEFTQVGPPTGCFVSVQRSDGAIPPHEVINGRVEAAVPDGSGGWYVVGAFNGAVPGTQTLGHVLPDGSLDPRFGRAVSFRVSAIAINNATLFLGGIEVSGSLSGAGVIAAFDVATAMDVKWSVHANAGVTHLAMLGDTLYAAGHFLNMDGQPRQRLAALDLVSGTVLPWDPNPQHGASTATILALTTRASAVLVGGLFLTIGGEPRQSVAAVHPVSGAATAWDAGLSTGSEVYSVVSGGSVVYVGGRFSSASGRQGVLALDSTTGGELPWNPALSGDANVLAMVTSIAVDTDTVYIAGAFKAPGSAAFACTAAFNKSNAVRRPWIEASLRSIVKTMVVGGAHVVVGGDFSLLAGRPRNHIAAIDTATGRVTAWNPDAPPTNSNVQSGVVHHLCVAGPAVFAAGSFERIGGADRSGLAALDPASGAATSWNPQITGTVSALAANTTRLYVAGLTAVDGQSREGLAAFVLTTGVLLPWAPSGAGADVRRLIATATTVFVAAGSGLAFDASTGAQLPWNPNVQTSQPGFNITDMALHDNVVYLIGGFDRVGGVTRAGLAAVTASAGALLQWAPIGLVAPRTIAVLGDFVYVALLQGGGDPPAKAVIKLSVSQAALVQADYVVEGFVSTITLSQTTRYFGGAFTSDVARQAAPNMVAFIR